MAEELSNEGAILSAPPAAGSASTCRGSEIDISGGQPGCGGLEWRMTKD